MSEAIRQGLGLARHMSTRQRHVLRDRESYRQRGRELLVPRPSEHDCSAIRSGPAAGLPKHEKTHSQVQTKHNRKKSTMYRAIVTMAALYALAMQVERNIPIADYMEVPDAHVCQ